MDSPNKFEILIRRKIPFLSSFLFQLILLFSLILFVLYLIMIPASNSPGEIKTVYFILVVPDWLKVLSVCCGFGLIILIPLYYHARLHKSANLTFHKDHFAIAGKQINRVFPYTFIKKVFCNDLHNMFRKPKGILQFVIREKKGKETTFRMKRYE